MCEKLIAAITIVLLLLCCTAPNTQRSSDAESVAFSTGFPLKVRHSGVFTSKADGREYVYFADAVTHKKLLLFTPDGKLTDSIPLNSGIDSLGEVGGLTIVDLDTIVLCSMYTNRLAFLDHKGVCRRVIDLNPLLTGLSGDKYEIWSSTTSPFASGHSFFFNAALIADTKRDSAQIKDKASGSGTRRYYERVALSPYLIRMEPKTKSTLTWVEDSFYYKLSPHISAMPEIGHYECLNNLVFIRSNYSPSIRVLDPVRLTSVASFDISSKYTPVFIKPRKLEGEELAHLQDSLNQRLATQGYVQAIQYDVPSGHYLVIVVHQISSSAPPIERGAARPFSILVYDNAFKFITEQSYDGRRYQMFFMLSLHKGTFIKRWEDQRTAMSGVHEFDRLHLNAN